MYLDKQRVLVAVGLDGDNMEEISTGLAFRPQCLA